MTYPATKQNQTKQQQQQHVMHRPTVVGVITAILSLTTFVSASVILPHTLSTTQSITDLNRRSTLVHKELSRRRLDRNIDLDHPHHHRPHHGAAGRTTKNMVAMAIPGYGLAEQVFVGGFTNFLQIYNFVITARILLSWFPQAQSIGALEPVYAITDPYLNLFRGIIPPVFGLDLSPILAFFVLNLMTSATASVGYEVPEELKGRFERSRFGRIVARGRRVVGYKM